MTQEQFQDALGMIDDDLIADVDKLRQQRDSSYPAADPSESPVSLDFSNSSNNILNIFCKKVIRREALKWGSLAASVCLLISVGFLWTVGGNKTADYAPGADNHYSKQEDAENIHMEAVQEAKPETASPTKPEAAPETLSSPPNLYMLTKEGDLIRAMTGTYSWHWTGNDGQTYGVEACSYHPLQSQEYLSLIQTTESSIQLDFDTSTHGEPYHISVQCWNDAYWDNIGVEGQSLAITNDSISLLEGGYIYEITAKWKNGTVHYAFYACYTSNH